MVLKDFTREVLRADLQDPAGIYEFGARYFSQMASGEGGGAASRLNAEELHAKIKGLFAQADADGNGYLDASEFKGVFTGLAAELGLSEFHIRQIMAEADENGDGVIEYSEFVQLAVDMIETMFARQDARDAQDAAQEEAQYRAEDMLLHGMSKEELDGVLIGIFQDADEEWRRLRLPPPPLLPPRPRPRNARAQAPAPSPSTPAAWRPPPRRAARCSGARPGSGCGPRSTDARGAGLRAARRARRASP